METFTHLCLGSVLQKKGDNKENMRLSASELWPRDFTSAPTGVGPAGVTGLGAVAVEQASGWLMHFSKAHGLGKTDCKGSWGQHLCRGRECAAPLRRMPQLSGAGRRRWGCLRQWATSRFLQTEQH